MKQNKGILLTIILFVFIIALFAYSFSTLAASSKEKQYESLQMALERDIVYCYANEGFYPPNLDYIKDNYGLKFDERLFFVDYKSPAKNLYPEVTVIWR